MRMPAATRPLLDDRLRGWRLLSRVVAGLLGGYLFTWGVVAFCTAGLFKLGADFHDAEFVAHSVGVLAYLGLFLWVFSARWPVWRVWVLLLIGGGVLAALASVIQSSIGVHP